MWAREIESAERDQGREAEGDLILSTQLQFIEEEVEDLLSPVR
jgi:hypothetical protein